jgi:hypothetical protein
MFRFAPDYFVNSVHVAPPESISFFILSFALAVAQPAMKRNSIS